MILMINKTAHELSILYGNKARFSYECIVDMSGLSPYEIRMVTYKVGDNHAEILKLGQVAEFHIDDQPEFFVRTEKYEEQFINQNTGSIIKHVNHSQPVWVGVDKAIGKDETIIISTPQKTRSSKYLEGKLESITFKNKSILSFVDTKKV